MVKLIVTDHPLIEVDQQMGTNYDDECEANT